MHICEKCGKPFFMKDALRNHKCIVKAEPVESNKTKKDLIAEAKELGIKGADRMTKDELIGAIDAT